MSTPPTIERWDEPLGAQARGTLIVLAGRGEATTVYTRFARRLSADAYRVRVVHDVSQDPRSSAALVRSLIAESDVLPVVLIGSDAGTVLALELASGARSGVAAVIAAGLPSSLGILADALTQLDARTADPAHRRLLHDDLALDPLALSRDLPRELTLPVPANLRVPVLAIHGAADAIAGVSEVQAYYGKLPNARVAIVHEGRHDILNDVTHRSVAATIVLFLEEVRAGIPTLELSATL